LNAIDNVAGVTRAALKIKFAEEPLRNNQAFQDYVGGGKRFTRCLDAQLSARRATLKASLLESEANKSSDEEMEDEAAGTTIIAPEENEQGEIPEGEEEDPMVLLRESRESNQRLSEKVAQLEAQIEEVVTERSRKRERKQEAKASLLQSKREQQHADQEVQTEAREEVAELEEAIVSQVL
jgi:hypothetical protein